MESDEPSPEVSQSHACQRAVFPDVDEDHVWLHQLGLSDEEFSLAEEQAKEQYELFGMGSVGWEQAESSVKKSLLESVARIGKRARTDP